jgi:hypothetical protein
MAHTQRPNGTIHICKNRSQNPEKQRTEGGRQMTEEKMKNKANFGASSLLTSK